MVLCLWYCSHKIWCVVCGGYDKITKINITKIISLQYGDWIGEKGKGHNYIIISSLVSKAIIGYDQLDQIPS